VERGRLGGGGGRSGLETRIGAKTCVSICGPVFGAFFIELQHSADFYVIFDRETR
jgi:hypothetical protein